ncbi:hypothetical protein [Psychromonas sp. Urea-02u-13]|uniref:hypothetical protein n=1 Tax=Psychromonas sp. Urea-02u-13 TaxID=2058326 RepID=UPI000C32AAB9|nr:hypothetical protein [Psychromonas sp. Urea-02u-13]PKG37258.1 hypothetical protein CXF74_19780 [Psychromonas sp. Urea-02u-13]
MKNTFISTTQDSKNMFTKKILTASIAASLLLSPLFLSAQAMADTITPMQQKQLTEIKSLLKQHPNMIEALHGNLTQYFEGQSTIAKTLKNNHDYLYNNHGKRITKNNLFLNDNCSKTGFKNIATQCNNYQSELINLD